MLKFCLVHCLHLFVLFLEFKERRPWNWLEFDPKLNTNQREVIKGILAPGNTSSPLVVFGPFGTGKTFTLNQAIRHLVAKKHNRILLCTHTNSAADIHITLLHDYLVHDGLKATTPLRIYQTNRRSVRTIREKVGWRSAGSGRDNESTARGPGRSHFQSSPILNYNHPSWLGPKFFRIRLGGSNELA